MTALFDKIKNRVSSISEYMFNGFTGAVTGAISGSIDNAKRLGKGAKLLSEAVSGFIIGTGEDAARQVVLEGKELREVDGARSVINGIMNAGLAIAVPLIIKGGQAVVNKIKTPGVNTVVGEVGEKAVKETSEEVTEEVVEKGAKSLANNADDMISVGINNVKIPSEEKLNNAISEWARMQKSLANSNGKIREFNTASVIFDSKTGQYYYGMNKGIKLSGDKMNKTLSDILPEKSLNDFKLANCSEVDGVNQALNNNANLEDLYIYTIKTNTDKFRAPMDNFGKPKPACENCTYAFKARVGDIISGYKGE